MVLSTRFRLVILFTATILTSYGNGLLLAFGSIIKSMLDQYQESRSAVASVQAILVGFGLSSGVVCGVFVARLGLWKASLIGATFCSFGFIVSFFASSLVHLYIFVGAIAGLGISIMFLTTTTALGLAYEGPQRVVVITIQNAGLGVSGITLPYFLNMLVHNYGIHGTFLIMGGLFLHCFPASRLYAILQSDHNKAREKCNDRKICSDEAEKMCTAWIKHELLFLKQRVWTILSPPYVFNCLGTGVILGTVIAFMSVMIDVLSWKGCSDSEALLGFPVANAIGFIARVSVVLSKNCSIGQSLMVPTVYTVCGFCGFLLIFIFSSVPVILSGCGLIGISMSGLSSASFSVVVKMVDGENISVGVGLITSAVGVSSAVLGPSFGALRDSSQAYGNVLLLACGLHFLGMCLYIAAIISWNLSEKAEVKKEETVDKYKPDVRDIETTYM